MRSLDTFAILERLVSYPTVSSDSNWPVIDWMQNYLADNGIESHRIPDATGLKSNLYASFGPIVEGAVVLSGHTDVVPVEGQAWTCHPFALTARGSRLYGRGTCDMKGFIATVLSQVPVWKAWKLHRPVYLMFSYDEELGCLGAPSMIAAVKDTLPKPAAVIVGEPTSMRVATQHKGICALRTRVTGIEAHSSLTHQGMSAVMLAGEMVAQLGGIAVELAALTNQAGQGFAPPYTTLSVNRITGGTAVNILAAACEFDWDIRALPGEDPASIIRLLASFVEERLEALTKDGKRCAVETFVQANAPPLQASDCFAARLARAARVSNANSIAVPFATEGGQFQSVGWPTVVCGPGSIEQAHKPDEYIECAELGECREFLDRAVMRQCVE